MRNHHAAHEGADGQALPEVLKHELVPQSSPQLVTDHQGLQQLIAQLRDAGTFAYDTEFIGEQTFHPHLCMIQVATADHIALIDPLAGLDVTPIWQLIADPSLLKLVHAGGQDLEPVVRHLDAPPRNIFDTQIAAGFIGEHYPISLTKLVTQFTGADMGKGTTFSQWDRRPLTDIQLCYAANDVRYLPLLHKTICDKLAELGTADWAFEEMRSLEEAEQYRFDPLTQKLRVRGLDKLSLRQSTIFDALLLWRAETAKHEDIPPRTLMHDSVVYDLAANATKAEKTGKDPLDVKGLPRPVKQHHGQSLLAAIQTGMTSPLKRKPKSRLPHAVRHREQIDIAWKAVQQRCEQCHLATGVVTSKKEVTQLVLSHIANLPARNNRLTQGWRAEMLADTVESALLNAAPQPTA